VSVADITRSQRAHRDGVPGCYVVNSQTGLAVAGPYRSREDAQREAEERNAQWPLDRVLEVQRLYAFGPLKKVSA
jgi:hypothetical protein